MAQKPSLPKGTRDFGPEQMFKRNYIIDTIKDVFRIMAENIENFKALIRELIPELPKKRKCQCSKML